MRQGAMLVLHWDGDNLIVMAEKDGREYRAVIAPLTTSEVEHFDTAHTPAVYAQAKTN